MKTGEQNKLSNIPSIEQLSPGSPFNVRQSPVAYTPSPGKQFNQNNELSYRNNDGLISMRGGEGDHNKSISHLKQVQKALDEKDKQI